MEYKNLELGLDSETVNKSQGSQPIRRNISLKLKQSSGTPNDCQKSAKREKASSKTSTRGSKNDFGDAGGGSHGNRSNPSLSRSANYVESLLKSKFMKVDNKLNMVGEKVADPLIHTCQICLLPILIYGRLMPCRHIFCFTCAKKTEKNCPRCSESVGRIEQSALGTVFVCTVGGSKHGVSGCHRTYLSQRDLQAHIKHRHMNQRSTSQQQQQQQQQLVATQEQLQQQQQHAVLLGPNVMHPPPSVDYLGQLPPSSVQYVNPPPIYLSRPPQQQMMMAGPPQGGHVIGMPQQVVMIQQQQQQQQQQNSDLRMNVSSTPQQQQQNIMVMTPRSTNLITVPIQDDRSLQQFQNELHQQQQQQQQAHFQHNAQFANSLVQQQQQHQAAQQQQLQASQTQFLMGQPQLLNRPPMVNQGHLRPQAGAGGQLVGQQLVSTQMNIHAFQRFEDSGQHTQYISTPQGVTTNAWITKRPPMGQQGPTTAGPNQQIQFY